MQLSEFHRVVDFVLPPATAMPGDNIGMQVASVRETARNVLVCLEVTDAVIQEAETLSCDVILTFHPLIYAPLKRLDRTERVGRLVSDLISRDIALLCVHTAFDVFPQGTNHAFASRMGLESAGSLDPAGMGIIATVPGISFKTFVAHVAEVCGSPVRYVPPKNDIIHRIAIVCGSGMSHYAHALLESADVFVTADIKYHAFHAAEGVMGLVDAGHFEMEQFVPQGLVQALQPHVSDTVTLRTSRVVTNPAYWCVPQQMHSPSHSFTS